MWVAVLTPKSGFLKQLLQLPEGGFDTLFAEWREEPLNVFGWHDDVLLPFNAPEGYTEAVLT